MDTYKLRVLLHKLEHNYTKELFEEIKEEVEEIQKYIDSREKQVLDLWEVCSELMRDCEKKKYIWQYDHNWVNVYDYYC